MRLIGIDPGLQRTGWGVIEAQGNRLRLVAAGIVRSLARDSLAVRLLALHDGLVAAIETHQPREAAVEHTYVNKNPDSTLKLGHARGIALMTPAKLGLAVAEYQAMAIKKSVVGYGHADKTQVAAMVARLLPGCDAYGHDAFDALAIAICHAHNRQTAAVWTPSPARDVRVPPSPDVYAPPSPDICAPPSPDICAPPSPDVCAPPSPHPLPPDRGEREKRAVSDPSPPGQGGEGRVRGEVDESVRETKP